MSIQPRYPIYVPSKGRSATPLTIRFLQRDRVPFYVVVEPQEAAAYEPLLADGGGELLILDKDDQGLIYARNWIKQHAIANGHKRHWQLDDNIAQIRRAQNGKRIPCDAGPALASVEDFCDRYTNVAIAGLNYVMFYYPRLNYPPFWRNARVYSCTLVLNEIPYTWRLRYNDDTDMCLQVLAGGWCTILFNVFLAEKIRTMVLKGGNTDDLYQGDGRLEMSRSLERMWPGVVTTHRRFGRPQHHVKHTWRRFDTPLQLRDDLDAADLAKPNEYGLELRAIRPVKSAALQAMLDEAQGQS